MFKISFGLEVVFPWKYRLYGGPALEKIVAYKRNFCYNNKWPCGRCHVFPSCQTGKTGKAFAQRQFTVAPRRGLWRIFNEKIWFGKGDLV
jgi:hypothetical protein